MRDLYGREDGPRKRPSGVRDDVASSAYSSRDHGTRRHRREVERSAASRRDHRLRVIPRGGHSARSLRAQIDELAAIGGIADPNSPPPPPAAEPLELLPRAIDPVLGEGSGTVSTAIGGDAAMLEPIPAGLLSGCASHEPEIAPGRKVHNPHRPHVIRLPEQVRRSAGHVPARLRPARDAGLNRMSRADRVKERQRRRQILLGLLAVVIVAAFVSAGLYWKTYSDEQAAQIDLTSSSPFDALTGSAGSGATSALAANASATDASLISLEPSDTPTGTGATEAVVAAAEAGVTPITPTPIMATYRDLNVYLPVSVEDLTEVGLHQANYTYSVQLETHMPSTSIADINGLEGTKRNKSLQKYGDGALLVGSYIQLWRSGRGTKPRTAADCGAEPGSLVVAPVTGTVTKVTTYKLEGKATDYEIHIVPDGQPDLEAVIIHIDDVVVREGDHVRGGASPIARVRDISGIVRSQLASYAAYRGNHTHVQINDTDCDAYLAKHKKD